MNTPSCVGQQIKLIRVSKGISAKFVAGKLNIHSSTLNKYENGQRKVNADLLPDIAEVLGVEVRSFFEQNVDETSNAGQKEVSPCTTETT